MQHTIHHAHAQHYSTEISSTKTKSGFIAWCENQQSNSLFWLAAIMLIQACVMVPAIWFALSRVEMGFIFRVLPSFAIVLCLVTNFAALRHFCNQHLRTNLSLFFSFK